MKPILTILLLLISLSSKAPPLDTLNSLPVVAIEALSPPEWHIVSTPTLEQLKMAHIDSLFNAVAMVESSGNPKAINKKEMAYGLVQVRQIRINDYYQHTGVRYTLKDMLDSSRAKEVFIYYANANYKLGDQYIIRSWNGGPHAMHKKKTIKYYNKVLQQLKK
jgi:hypothetical protein